MKAQTKYVAVNIPIRLMRRIEKLVITDGGFMSATDYMTYVLRVILSQRPEESEFDLFSTRDLMVIRSRLKALGCLSHMPQGANKKIRRESEIHVRSSEGKVRHELIVSQSVSPSRKEVRSIRIKRA